MNRKAILMAMLAFAFGGVEAASITTDQAAKAARAWAARGRVLGARMGRTVQATTRHAFTTNATEYSFYSVKMKGGGTVFLSSDDESEPIVAFTSSTNDYSKIDRRSPFWALLTRDAIVRSRLRDQKRRNKWQTLLTSEAKLSSPILAAPKDRYTDEEFEEDPTVIDDMRVMPLLSTKWSQTTHNDEPNEELGEYYDITTGLVVPATGQDCYNYYTPMFAATYRVDEEGTTKTIMEHAPCGCTATATSQIMRYHRWPLDKVEAKTFVCTVDETDTKMTMRGGFYDWDLMSDIPSTEPWLTKESREAIGHLTYDVGVALKSSYSAGSTGAQPQRVAEALMGALGYANARTYWHQQVFEEGATSDKGKVTADEGLHNKENREQVIYANLDAGKPVLFAIYGYSTSGNWAGHAVVGDGYGFATIKDDEGIVTNTTAYVHVNMGWSGADDAWYNLPEIHAVETGASGADVGFNFTVLAGAVYNIFTNETGEIISGRVFDENGEVVPGAIVRIPSLGLRSVADEKGIYSFIVPSAKASYQLETDAKRGNYEDTINAKITTLSGGKAGNSWTDVGNVWGADLQLELSSFADSIEIVRGGMPLPDRYGTLDAAIAAARDGDEIRILRPTILKDAVCFLSNKVELVWGPGAADKAYTNGVFTCNAGAKIRILDGGRLSVGDCLYLPKSLAAIEVASEGVLAVQGDVRVPEVRTEGERCFELLGEITTNIVLQAHSLNRYARVGTAFCTPEAVTNCAPFLVNPADMYMCVACSDVGGELALVWDLENTPDDNRDATLDVGHGPVNYRNLDRLLQDVVAGTTVTVYRTCALSKPLTVTGDLVLTSGVAAVEISVKKTSGIVVGEGAFLSVYGLKFTGFGGGTFITVDGGDLYLGADTSFADMTGYASGISGIITVHKGRAVIDGATFVRCQSLGEEARGGAIFLDGPGCDLELRDATIWKCRSISCGGGIYVGGGSGLRLAGEVSVIGNMRNDSLFDSYDKAMENYPERSITDNIYVCAPKKTKVWIADSLTAQPANIGLRFSSNGDGFGNPKSTSVLKCAIFEDPDMSAEEKVQAAASFVSDTDTLYRGVVSDDGTAVRWRSNEGVSDNDETAWTRVIYPKSAETNYYDSIDKAFAFLRTGVEAIIEPLRDEDEKRLRGYYEGWPVYYWFNYNAITKPVTITQPVTIRSRWDRPTETNGIYRFTGERMNIRVLAGGSLTVTNVCMNGHYYYHYQDLNEWLMIEDYYVWVGGPLALVEVKGGELSLKAGADFNGSDVATEGCRASGAIAVWDRGVLTMEKGSLIHNFKNEFVDEVEGSGVGSGITVDNGVAYLRGGKIEWCSAYKNAGVFIGNEGTVHLSGEVTIHDNFDLNGKPSNLAVQDLSSLYLADVLTDVSGVTDGFMAQTNVFGQVDVDCPASDQELVDSAARFHRDDDPTVPGLVVTNEAVKLLVWSTAVKTDAESGKRYYEDELSQRYYELTADTPSPTPVRADPIAFQSITRLSASDWRLVVTNRKAYCKYAVAYTDDLAKGFVLTGDWVTATSDGPWTNDVHFAEEKKAMLFWRALGQDGEKPASAP